MVSVDVGNSGETQRLLTLAGAGEGDAWGQLLTRHQDRLTRTVAFRLDRRLGGRIDPADVIQEVFLEASACRERYLRQPTMPFFLWLRGITTNKLRELQRHHLGTRMRDAGREVSLHQGAIPEATSVALVAQLLGKGTRPSQAAMRAEAKTYLQEALNTLDENDREVLLLRHFEQLNTSEAAAVLGISQAAAGKRYLRALQRLKDGLTNICGGLF